MRRFTLGTLTLAAAAMLGAGGCGSKDTGPSFNGTISDSAAASFGASTVDFIGAMMVAYGDGSPSIEIPLSPAVPVAGVALLNRGYALAGVARRFTLKGRPAGGAPLMRLDGADCTPVISGDTTDADEDGFPANETLTVGCTTVDSEAHDTVETHLTVHIADVAGIWGFDVSVNATQDESSPDGKSHLALSESEFFKVTTTRDDDNVTVDITSTATPTGSAATGGQVHYNWNSNFTPAEGLELGAESPPDGYLAFSGGFFVTSLEAPSTNFSFNISTTTPLTFSAECGEDPPFTNGTVTGHLNGANADVGFTVTYTGCGEGPSIDGHGNATS